MFYPQGRQVPALLKAKVTTTDEVSVTLIPGARTGYMVRDEFISEVGKITSKIFPNESTAKSYAQGAEVIPVEVKWIR